jgi:calcium/calmodulin-dependent protein kinase I
MGNDCSLLRTCLENTADKVGRIVSDESPIYYEQNAADAEKRRMPLRKREQSYSEPVLETYEKQLQQVVTGVPQEFLKLYEFGKLLGVGTTSKVYQIYHKRRKYIGHRKPFACKVIDKRKLTLGMVEEDVEPLLQQLRKEVDILRRINHPHIVAFQDFVETKRLLFIVTEYLPGGELFDYILKHGPLPEDLACTSLFGIFSAVAYLHDRGVIHRDIKAENVIFFHKVNGEVSLKLIDFGFSTILKHDLTGSFLGTGGYIAPEIRQNKQYSTSVDNWALGVLLYCTMSAKLPFSISLEALPADRTECSSHFKLRFPAKQWCGVSDLCKDLIRQLLNVDPFTRLTAKESLNHPWVRALILATFLVRCSSLCIPFVFLLVVSSSPTPKDVGGKEISYGCFDRLHDASQLGGGVAWGCTKQ